MNTKRLMLILTMLLFNMVAFGGLPFPPLPPGYDWYFAENQEPYDVYKVEADGQFQFGLDYFGAASYQDAHDCWWWDCGRVIENPVVYIWGVAEPLAGAWVESGDLCDHWWHNFTWELGPAWPSNIYPWNGEPVNTATSILPGKHLAKGHSK